MQPFPPRCLSPPVLHVRVWKYLVNRHPLDRASLYGYHGGRFVGGMPLLSRLCTQYVVVHFQERHALEREAHGTRSVNR